MVGNSCTIYCAERFNFFSLWPSDIRPSALNEHSFIFSLLDELGTYEIIGAVSYQTPDFEVESLRLKPNIKNEHRQGILVHFRKNKVGVVPKVKFVKSDVRWHRFHVGSEQIALRIDPSAKYERKALDFELSPFVLSNTSRRNVQQRDINVWTHKNTVAKLINPSFLVSMLERARKSVSVAQQTVVFLAQSLHIEVSSSEVRQATRWTHRL